VKNLAAGFWRVVNAVATGIYRLIVGKKHE
jgi:hypothetical protein